MIRLIYSCIVLFSLACSFVWNNQKDFFHKQKLQVKKLEGSCERNVPPCIQMHDAILKYSKKYNIPTYIAFGIAEHETGYTGAFQWNYTTKLSIANGAGPMQVTMETAKQMWPGKRITVEKLRDDVDFNVETSMKTLRYYYSVSGNWQLAVGAYNTGSPVANYYACSIVNGKKGK